MIQYQARPSHSVHQSILRLHWDLQLFDPGILLSTLIAVRGVFSFPDSCWFKRQFFFVCPHLLHLKQHPLNWRLIPLLALLRLDMLFGQVVSVHAFSRTVSQVTISSKLFFSVSVTSMLIWLDLTFNLNSISAFLASTMNWGFPIRVST